MKREAITFAMCISLTGMCHPLQQESNDTSAKKRPVIELKQSTVNKAVHFSPSHATNLSNEQALASHRLLKYFAIEARVDSLGEYRLEDSFDPLQTQFATYTGNAVGILPVGDSGLELFGHLGAGVIANKMDSTFADNDESSAVGTFGMGLRYVKSASSPLSLIAGYDAYHFQTEAGTRGRSDLLLSKTSLGLNYRF